MKCRLKIWFCVLSALALSLSFCFSASALDSGLSVNGVWDNSQCSTVQWRGDVSTINGSGALVGINSTQAPNWVNLLMLSGCPKSFPAGGYETHYISMRSDAVVSTQFPVLANSYVQDGFIVQDIQQVVEIPGASTYFTILAVTVTRSEGTNAHYVPLYFYANGGQVVLNYMGSTSYFGTTMINAQETANGLLNVIASRLATTNANIVNINSAIETFYNLVNGTTNPRIVDINLTLQGFYNLVNTVTNPRIVDINLSLQTISAQLVQIFDEIRNQQSQDQQDRDNIEDTQADADQSAQDAQADVDNATTSLMDAAGSVVSALTTTTPGTCVVDIDLGHGMNLGNRDLCSGVPQSMINIINLCVSLVMVPAMFFIGYRVVKKMVNMFSEVQR